jgi:hypothetical protein
MPPWIFSKRTEEILTLDNRDALYVNFICRNSSVIPGIGVHTIPFNPGGPVEEH